MVKEKEDKPGIIPQNEWREDLEVLVRMHVARIGPQPKTTKIYLPNKYPTSFRDPFEEAEYRKEEIRRCIHGYDGLCGKMYGFLNYGKMKSAKSGSIRPDFRTIDHTWFQKIESLHDTPGRGIVCIKRRRVGASWKEAWDALHDCSFLDKSNPNKSMKMIGMNSKSESDSRKMFTNVKFMHNAMPDWMRPRASTTDRRDFMEFAYWYDTVKKQVVATKGLNTKKLGSESTILSVAPTDNAHEGNAYSKLIIDEAGKIENLLTIWSFAEDCLMDNTERVGIPIIFGTVGDIDKNGMGLMDMWKKSDTYNLDKFAFWGYNGLICDEYGNDQIEDAVRWIIYERDKKKEANKAVREAFIQKYPLEEKDAFNQVSNGGIGDSTKINAQLTTLMEKPPLKSHGWMRRGADGVARFIPNDQGPWIIYEHPDHSRKDGYTAVCDPAEDDDVEKSRDTSDLALAIMAKPFGLSVPKIAAELVWRPKKLNDYYEQAAMGLEYFNKTKFLPELNKGGWRMKAYFDDHYPHLLELAPKAANSAKAGFELRHGLKMTADRKQQMIGLIEDYIDNYYEHINSSRFLEQCKVFGDDHADDDLAVAIGWCLIVMQADKRVVRSVMEDQKKLNKVRYKMVNGAITMINQGVPVTHRPQYAPKSSLFRR